MSHDRSTATEGMSVKFIEVKCAEVALLGEDEFAVPPARLCRRSTDLAATALHDLLTLGAGWDDLERLADEMDLPGRLRSPEAILDWVGRRGRLVVGEYLGDHGFVGHVEHA